VFGTATVTWSTGDENGITFCAGTETAAACNANWDTKVLFTITPVNASLS
jgi:hypothetical protein